MKVHPCLCGFTCESYSQMKHHRSSCSSWRGRPNPRALAVERQRRSHQRPERNEKVSSICPLCHRRSDHHDSSCVNSQAESARRENLRRHGIDPKLFALFLGALVRRNFLRLLASRQSSPYPGTS